ncbi:hypothetical protein GCM10009613_41300 [Pseudonocardia kongjuensis]|uniref:Uncharacterized protein n=1 Tax=Pseudonocardia kongjuensis TaxID=102227 RepID=A0ABN1XZV6_9PSEU
MSATGTTGTGELESVRSAARARPTGDPAGGGCELTRSRPRAGQLHRHQTNPGSSAGTHDTVANDAVAYDVIGYDVIGYDVVTGNGAGACQDLCVSRSRNCQDR